MRHAVIVTIPRADDPFMERLLVEDVEDATARAFSIAQLGDEAQDVVIFGRNGSIEERRTFRPRS